MLYFELVFDNQQKVELGSGGVLLHPLLRKSYDVLLPGFVDQILEEHGLLLSPKSWPKLLYTLPPSSKVVTHKLLKKFDDYQELLYITKSLLFDNNSHNKTTRRIGRDVPLIIFGLF